MTAVAYIPPIPQCWILVHEYPSVERRFGVDRPVHFDSTEGIPVVINGLASNTSPYVGRKVDYTFKGRFRRERRIAVVHSRPRWDLTAAYTNLLLPPRAVYNI